MKQLLTLLLIFTIFAGSAFGQTAKVKTLKTGHFHQVPGKKLSQWQSQALARVYALSDKTKERFRENPTSVMGNSPDLNVLVQSQGTRNSHCQILKDAKSKPCNQDPSGGEQKCECTATWEQTGQKSPEGVPYCEEKEHDNCKNACCFSLCNCIHNPPPGCTLAECRELRALIRALVAQGVLIESGPAHSHTGP